MYFLGSYSALKWGTTTITTTTTTTIMVVLFQALFTTQPPTNSYQNEMLLTVDRAAIQTVNVLSGHSIPLILLEYAHGLARFLELLPDSGKRHNCSSSFDSNPLHINMMSSLPANWIPLWFLSFFFLSKEWNSWKSWYLINYHQVKSPLRWLNKADIEES